MGIFRRLGTALNLISISDPALAAYFRFGNPNYSGVEVNEGSALGLSAFYRACRIVAGAIAQLPLITYMPGPDGSPKRVGSVFDDPGGLIGLTPYEWKETIILHMMCHGDAFLGHIRTNAGTLAALAPFHPLSVAVDPPPREAREGDEVTPEMFSKSYTISLQDGRRIAATSENMTQVSVLSTDGRRGLGVIATAANSLGIAIAGDRSAANMFSSGALIAGLVTPAEGEEIQSEDSAKITDDLNSKVQGWENAGALAYVNRRLQFTPWTMTHREAQFLESRQFQIEEIARWTGVPPHLLMQTEKQTSWGTGVAEQNRGLSRFTLADYTGRLESRFSIMLPRPRWCAFDFTAWERPTPEQEIQSLVTAAGGPILTPDEARAKRGLPALPDGQGETLRDPVPSLTLAGGGGGAG